MSPQHHLFSPLENDKNCICFNFHILAQFLADRTKGRAYASTTVLRPSVVCRRLPVSYVLRLNGAS